MERAGMPVLDPYTKDYFKIVNRDEEIQAYELQKQIINLYNPQSVIDFGAATGLYLTQFTCPKKGIDVSVEAFDESVRAIDRTLLEYGDLTKMLRLGKYDLGICIEVLEHIESKHAKMVVKNMANHANRWIVTASQPGQAGLNHVNCQPPSYWERLFKPWEFKRNYVDEIRLVYPVSLVPHQFWIIRNLMVFEKS